MIPCQNCGKINSSHTNFCRFCGTKITIQQPVPEEPYTYAPPRPYAWKTDEFQTQNEARPTELIDRVQPQTEPFGQMNRNYRPAPLAYQQPQRMTQPFRCPHCMSQYLPRLERRISTAGWITFSILLVFFFPLFWIGLLIKEDVAICPVCRSRVS